MSGNEIVGVGRARSPRACGGGGDGGGGMTRRKMGEDTIYILASYGQLMARRSYIFISFNPLNNPGKWGLYLYFIEINCEI